MADSKISQLSDYSSPIPTDLLPIVDITNLAAKRIQLSNLAAFYQPLIVIGPTGSGGCSYYIDGASDDVQINAAITSLPSTGGTILLKKGTIYDITAPILLKNHVTLLGEGRSDPNYSSSGGTILRRNTSYDGPVIQNADSAGGNKDITLRDLSINGNKASGSPTTLSKGVYYSNCIRTNTINVAIFNCKDLGFKADVAGIHYLSRVVVRANGNGGILLGSGGASDSTIVDCEAGSNTGTGIALQSVSNCIVANNICYLSSSHGIHFYNSQFNMVLGNRSNTNGLSGIVLSGSTLTSTRSTLVGNNCYDNGTTGGGSGIRLEDTGTGALYNIIQGNNCYDTQGTSTQDYGIETRNNADHNVIVSNVCINNQLGGISTVGSNNIVRNNKGYITENASTATIASGTTSIVVSHGLSVTPTAKDFTVTPTNNMGNATKFWISNITSTQFTVNVNVDPGVSTATFAWKAVVL